MVLRIDDPAIVDVSAGETVPGLMTVLQGVVDDLAQGWHDIGRSAVAGGAIGLPAGQAGRSPTIVMRSMSRRCGK